MFVLFFPAQHSFSSDPSLQSLSPSQIHLLGMHLACDPHLAAPLAGQVVPGSAHIRSSSSLLSPRMTAPPPRTTAEATTSSPAAAAASASCAERCTGKEGGEVFHGENVADPIMLVTFKTMFCQTLEFPIRFFHTQKIFKF